MYIKIVMECGTRIYKVESGEVRVYSQRDSGYKEELESLRVMGRLVGFPDTDVDPTYIVQYSTQDCTRTHCVFPDEAVFIMNSDGKTIESLFGNTKFF